MEHQEPQFSDNPQHLRFPDDLQQPHQNPAAFEPEIALPRSAYTCLNALKHGGTAESMFIQGENPAEFHSLLKEFFEEYRPGTTSHSAIVTDYCRARWMLWRRQRGQSFAEYSADAQTPTNGTFSDQVLTGIDRYDRYITQAERAFQRAFQNVEAIRKDAVNDDRWLQQFELQVKKHEMARIAFEEVQKRRALAAAREAIAEEAKAESKRQFAADSETRRKSSQPIILHKNRWLIQQTSFVKEVNGNTHIVSITPSNEDVKKMIESQDRFMNPPVGVLRTFCFAEGPVPVDYQWVLKIVDPEAIKASPMANPPIRATFTFPNWEKLAANEAALLYNQAWEAKQQE